MSDKTNQTDIAVINDDPAIIQQLYKEPAILAERDKLVVFLNQEPPAEWVKIHPNIKDHKYIPIDKIEWMLKRFFKVYNIEIKDYRQLLNAISVSVRVHYLDPIDNVMTWQDGAGAWDLQTSSGTGVLKLDGSNLNRGAVPMALGIAESIAIKDACDHIGNIFGANLNRKDAQPNMPDSTLSGIVNQKEHDRMVKLIEMAKSRETLDGLREHLTEALTPIFEAKWMIVK